MQTTPSRVIRRKDTPGYLGIASSTLGNLLNPKSAYFDSEFPDKIQLGLRAVGFLRDDLDAWLEKRANTQEVQ